MWLVVGLGNPGSQYQTNRHNVGFMVVDELLRRGRAPAPRAKFGAEINEASVAGDKALFCKPMEFMNVSGQVVQRVAQFWKVTPAETVVVHDELDIPFSRLKLGAGGGHGGHNGLRSIIADWGTADFVRVRFGICAIVRLRCAVEMAFLILRRAACRCLVVAMSPPYAS